MGYILDETTSSCTQCSRGTYSNTNSTLCINCPAGYTSNSNNSYCVKCSTGYYSSSPGSICLKCPIGTFSNTTGLTSCYSCPIGFTSNNARTGCETSLRLLDSSSKNSNSPIVQNCHKCSYGSYSASMDSKSYNSYPKGTSISLDRKGFVHSDKGGTSQYLNWNERYYFDRVVCIIFKRCSTFYYSSKKIYKK